MSENVTDVNDHWFGHYSPVNNVCPQGYTPTTQCTVKARNAKNRDINKFYGFCGCGRLVGGKVAWSVCMFSGWCATLLAADCWLGVVVIVAGCLRCCCWMFIKKGLNSWVAGLNCRIIKTNRSRFCNHQATTGCDLRNPCSPTQNDDDHDYFSVILIVMVTVCNRWGLGRGIEVRTVTHLWRRTPWSS